MGEINFYFRKAEYGWLSNFWRANQRLPLRSGAEWLFPTNENYYQSRKAVEPETELWIANAPTPYAAMIAGRCIRKKDFVPDWEAQRADVMLTGLRAKFGQNPQLQLQLLETGDAVLHEDSPSDLYWGSKGADMLGKLLMQVRQELMNDG